MTDGHDSTGLIKFLGRYEWRNCFMLGVDEHFGAVLDAGDMEFDDLADILGQHWTGTLWGCAFENFLTREFDVDGINKVDEYLRRRGWKEGAGTKAYMKALRSSFMSLCEVSDIVPGKSWLTKI